MKNDGFCLRSWCGAGLKSQRRIKSNLSSANRRSFQSLFLTLHLLVSPKYKQLYFAPHKSNLLNFKAFNRYQSWDYDYIFIFKTNKQILSHECLQILEPWRGGKWKEKVSASNNTASNIKLEKFFIAILSPTTNYVLFMKFLLIHLNLFYPRSKGENCRWRQERRKRRDFAFYDWLQQITSLHGRVC